MPKSHSHRTNQASRQPARRRGIERRISLRSDRRTPPDLQKIAKAVVALALAQAEKEAEAQLARDKNDEGQIDEV